ncbi:uncharacterized protein moto [Eucyclogobius newberryi]|uniref:uncharacterized protein moto n=1 Tax=Eucyclogobius newberryi TaxID=166745 RepID=UPI003B5A7638
MLNQGFLGQRSKNIWSPKILRDELLQYFQSEDKTQYNSNFASNNYASHDAFGTQAQGQAVNKDTSSNGFNTNQLFNLPNGVHNSFSQPQKTPPGLTLPQKIPNAYLQLQANNYENGNDRANRESIGNFPDLNHIFRPQNDTDGSDLFNGNHYNQVTDKPAAGANEQYVSQDLNQLVRSFQSFPTGEQGRAAFENAPQREDNKWGSPNAFMQGANGSAEMQRRLGQDFGSKRSNRTKKQPTYRPSYSIPNPEYSPRQKLATGNRNTRLPFGANNFTARQIQQNPLKFKPQMQKERKRIDGYGDAVTATAEVLPEDKRLALSQNDFYDLPGSARPRRFDREDNMIQLQFPYAKNDPRRRPSQITNPNFSPRGSPVYSVGVPNMDVADVVSGGFNPASKDAIVRKGEGTYDSILPTPAARGGPVLLYYFYLEECYEQWRSLEKERKRTEIVLSKTFPGKGTLAFSNSSLPKTPTNPTRVDYLIVNQMREQAWVSFLLDKMECLSSVALSPNIYNALSKHHMAVSVTIARRKEEICNLRQRAHFTEERDTILLVVALKDLSATTRKLRTTVWCALQMTLPKCVPRLEPPVNQENQDEEGSALFEGYSYRM